MLENRTNQKELYPVRGNEWRKPKAVKKFTLATRRGFLTAKGFRNTLARLGESDKKRGLHPFLRPVGHEYLVVWPDA